MALRLNLIYILPIILTLYLSYFIIERITKYVLAKLEHITVFFSKFPDINESDLKKFDSFDSELGWERQPNENREKNIKYITNGEKIEREVSYSTDAYGSRICEVDRETGKFSIATYGDSYCFGNEVSDKETFQHYLSHELGVHVSNYGVAGYGLDQALLRMKRRFNEDPADYVIIALSDRHAIRQLGSVYQYYFKPDNTWAIKPRFKLQNKELRHIPCLLNDKKQLLYLDNYSEKLFNNDYHYNHWFENHLITSPYLFYWFRNPRDTLYAVATSAEYITRDRPLLSPLRKIMEPMIVSLQNSKKEERMEEYWKYRTELEDEFTDLFCKLLGEFSEFVCSHNSIPIFLPMRDPRQFQTEINVDPLGRDTINAIQKNCPKLHIIDPRLDIMSEINDPGQIYIRENPPDGHLNPFGNKLYSKHISNFIIEHRNGKIKEKI